MADFDNRLPRGRTYCRNGSVVHLEVLPGKIKAVVAGGSFYKVDVTVKPLPKERWEAIKAACAGSIGAVMDLLMGRLSPEVMEVISDPKKGMFPLRNEVSWTCSCPDWASLCKHSAAVFYGVGSRLDEEPALIFVLRGVDPTELAAGAADVDGSAAGEDALTGDLEAIFGIDVEDVDLKPAKAKGAKKANLAAKKAEPVPATKTTKKAEPVPKAKAVKKVEPVPESKAAKKVEPVAATRAPTKTKPAPGATLSSTPPLDLNLLALKGSDIRYLRDQAGLTIPELAQVLKVTAPSITRWEASPGVVNLHFRTSMSLIKWGQTVLPSCKP
jgi:uncharacterized Zn finger protein